MKTVIITGVTGGIGKAILKELYNDKYNIIGMYNKNDNEAQRLRDNYAINIYKVDLLDYKMIQESIAAIIDKHHRIDILVNNAGISQQQLFSELTSQDITEMLDVNLKGAMLLTKEVIPIMVANKYGKIINISSIWGVCGGSCEVHYSASKAGIIGFTKALSRELGPSNITVNAIAPGLIDTQMNNNLCDGQIAEFLQGISLQRIGYAEEVAYLASFLASDKASYITGQVISIDGGLN